MQGRDRKPRSEKRKATRLVAFRITDGYHAALAERAEAAGQRSIATLARTIVEQVLDDPLAAELEVAVHLRTLRDLRAYCLLLSQEQDPGRRAETLASMVRHIDRVLA